MNWSPIHGLFLPYAQSSRDNLQILHDPEKDKEVSESEQVSASWNWNGLGFGVCDEYVAC